MIRREEFEVGASAVVEIRAHAGSVELRAQPSDRVVVTIDGARADDWDVVHVGDTVSVRPGDAGRGWRTRSVRLHLELPAGCAVDVSTASADVVARGELGEVRARTASGDVRLEAAEGVEVATASGDIRVDRTTTDATCSTMSGGASLGDVGGRLTASAASGDVRARSVSGDLDVSTASGDVVVEQCHGDDVDVKCVSGDITLGLPSGIRVDPDIRTLSGRTSLPSRTTAAQPDSARRAVRVRLRTVSGDIRIDRVA